jgi:hypothetical protein
VHPKNHQTSTCRRRRRRSKHRRFGTRVPLHLEPHS